MKKTNKSAKFSRNWQGKRPLIMQKTSTDAISKEEREFKSHVIR